MLEFERYLRCQELAEKSIAEYRGAVCRFLEWKQSISGEPFCPDRLRAEDLAAYVDFLRQRKGLSAYTVNKNQGGLRKWLEFLQTRGWKGGVHLPNVKCPGRKPGRPVGYEPREVEAILRAIEMEPNAFLRARDRCICYFELYRGVRIGAALPLKMADVILTPGNQRMILRSSRGPRADEIDLGDRQLLGAVLEWVDVRSASPHADSPFFFVSRRSGRMTYGAAEKMMQRISNRAQVEFRSDRLRQTYLNGSGENRTGGGHVELEL